MRGWPLLLVAACGRIGFDPRGGGDGGALMLDITVVGGGAVTGPGIACADRCSYSTDPVTLTAVAMEGWQLESWSNACAGSTCAIDASQAITVTFSPAPITANVAFVSSIPGPWTGLANMDAFCMTRAAAGGLSGNFIALLSTSSTPAPMRLAGHRGWVRRDGLPVLDMPSDLTAATMLPRALVIDETGAAHARAAVATGTNFGKISSRGTCGDWTTTTGSTEGGLTTYASDNAFSLDGTGCAVSEIYCFQIDRSVAVDLHPPTFPVGRYVFLLSTTILSGGGVAAFDAACASEAMTAGLPGTYRGLVATETESVAQRLGSVAGIWRRPDGMVVTRNGLDHLPLDAAINVQADGTRVSQTSAWFGAIDFASLGPASCASWTATTGLSPYLAVTDVSLETTFKIDCGLFAMRLVCAESL